MAAKIGRPFCDARCLRLWTTFVDGERFRGARYWSRSADWEGTPVSEIERFFLITAATSYVAFIVMVAFLEMIPVS
jgi:hypothetical protein